MGVVTIKLRSASFEKEQSLPNLVQQIGSTIKQISQIALIENKMHLKTSLNHFFFKYNFVFFSFFSTVVLKVTQLETPEYYIFIFSAHFNITLNFLAS